MAGWIAAVILHAGYNNMLLPPLAATLVLLTVLPIVILLVFRRSEAATHEWITGGLDLDLELLQLVQSEEFVHTRFGSYLRDLKDRVPGPLVVDMFCLLRVELELAIQAKAMLMARQAGLQIPGRRRPAREPGRVALPRRIDRPHRTSGARTAAGDVRPRQVAQVSVAAIAHDRMIGHRPTGLALARSLPHPFGMTEHRQQLGIIGENLAVAELTRRGYAILERRYRTRYGEIDIVADDEGTIVFVEVKARATGSSAAPSKLSPCGSSDG